MTAAVFLLFAGLLSLHAALGADARPFRRKAAIAVAGLAELPLAFGPVVPISHFIFEATGRPMLWAALAVVAMLLLAFAGRLAGRWRAGVGSEADGPFAVVLICHVIWLGSAMWLSDYEQGVRTPDVWDAPIYIVDWLSALLACVFLAIAAWRIPGSGVPSRLLIAVYLCTVASIAYGTVA